MPSDATKAIRTAKSVAQGSPHASKMTLQEALIELDEGDPWNPEFWIGVNYAKAVLNALAGEGVS